MHIFPHSYSQCIGKSIQIVLVTVEITVNYLQIMCICRYFGQSYSQSYTDFHRFIHICTRLCIQIIYLACKHAVFTTYIVLLM